jgi:shikimate kinase
MTNQQIIIVGFMGSGKTTLAQEVGRLLGYPVIDLDESITGSEGRSAAEIIQQDGENSFRKLETQMLDKVLSENSRVVIAAGGGAWTIAENRRLIAERKARAIWLDAPFELCWSRIEVKRETRPLAPSRQAAEKLYRERRSAYELADLRIVVTENESTEEIARRIVDRQTGPVQNRAR